jgi:hypothetical protein
MRRPRIHRTGTVTDYNSAGICPRLGYNPIPPSPYCGYLFCLLVVQRTIGLVSLFVHSISGRPLTEAQHFIRISRPACWLANFFPEREHAFECYLAYWLFGVRLCLLYAWRAYAELYIRIQMPFIWLSIEFFRMDSETRGQKFYIMQRHL